MRAAILSIVAFLAVGAGDAKPRLGFSGLGDIKVGTPAKELGERFQFDVSIEKWQTAEEAKGCRYVASSKLYPGVAIMLADHKVVRIDIGKPDFASISGARVGMTSAEVRAKYLGWFIKETLHPYMDEDGRYLEINSFDGKYAIIFELNQDKVVGFRAGLIEPVRYIEGCS